MDYKRWGSLIILNLFLVGSLSNKYDFISDITQLVRLSRDGLKTSGVVVAEKDTTCSIGPAPTTHLKCIYPVVEFTTIDGRTINFRDSHKYTKGSSLYNIHNKVKVYYSTSNPYNARAFVGDDLTSNTITGGVWFLFIIGITVFIDHTILFGYKGLLRKKIPSTHSK